METTNLAEELQTIFREEDGENSVRARVNEILSRRGTPEAKSGEQMALMAAIDKLEGDRSDTAGQILRVIFGRFDAAEVARSKRFPPKSPTKPMDETPQFTVGMLMDVLAKSVSDDPDQDRDTGCGDFSLTNQDNNF